MSCLDAGIGCFWIIEQTRLGRHGSWRSIVFLETKMRASLKFSGASIAVILSETDGVEPWEARFRIQAETRFHDSRLYGPKSEREDGFNS